MKHDGKCSVTTAPDGGLSGLPPTMMPNGPEQAITAGWAATDGRKKMGAGTVNERTGEQAGQKGRITVRATGGA
jgi:hypothetical protein